MNPDVLLAHYDRVSEAPDAIPRLRQFILDLAVRGKLVEQDPNDEPSSKVLERIAKEKIFLIEQGLIRRERGSSRISGNDVQHSLPAGWSEGRLGALSHLITKGTTPTTLGYAYVDSGINFIKVENIDRGQIQRSSISQFIGEETDRAMQRSRLAAGDLLFSIAGTIGKTCIVCDEDLPANTNQALAIIRGTSAGFNPSFLLIQLDSYVSEVTKSKARGGAMPNISLGDLAELVVVLPPLAEQHRIVAKVDELMALCDRLEKAKAEREQARDQLVSGSLQRLNQPDEDREVFRNDARFTLRHLSRMTTRPEHIKQLRQTILNLAVRGKLVEQDPNDEPASEFLTRIVRVRQTMAKKRGSKLPQRLTLKTVLPDGWTDATLSEVAIFENGDRSSNYPSGTDIITSGVPFFSTKNLSSYKLNLTGLDYISESKFESLRGGKVQDLDILITLRGSVGKFGLFRAVDGVVTGFINAQLLIVRSVIPEFVGFLLTFMKSEVFTDQIETRASGSATPQLSAGQLSQVVIPLPPLGSRGINR